MNTKMRRRLVVVTGVIIIVLAIVLAVIGSSSAARSVTVAQAFGDDLSGKRIQVSGTVVDNSYSTSNNVLTFDIYDPEGEAGQILHISYDGAASSTFGNGVIAICTGKMDPSGAKTLVCTELVTKCPSKYENATDALTIARLVNYGESVINKNVKVVGVVKQGTMASVTESDIRFVALDADDAAVEMPVRFDGAMPENVMEGSSVVLMGALTGDGSFLAVSVAQEG